MCKASIGAGIRMFIIIIINSLMWEMDGVHMRNRLPIFASTDTGADWNGRGEIGEAIPYKKFHMRMMGVPSTYDRRLIHQATGW